MNNKRAAVVGIKGLGRYNLDPLDVERCNPGDIAWLGVIRWLSNDCDEAARIHLMLEPAPTKENP